MVNIYLDPKNAEIIWRYILYYKNTNHIYSIFYLEAIPRILQICLM